MTNEQHFEELDRPYNEYGFQKIDQIIKRLLLKILEIEEADEIH